MRRLGSRPPGKKRPADGGIVVRAARRTDAPLLARALLLSSRSHRPYGFWDFGLDRPEAQCLAFLARLTTTRAVSFAHHSTFLVAELDGHAGAALSAYDPADGGKAVYGAAAAEVERALRWPPTENEEAREKWAEVAPHLFPEPAGTWIVENVATLPELRRRGLVNALLAAALARGRARGLTTCQLTIHIGNTPAQRAYERAGFAVVDAHRHPAFERLFGVPGLALMRRAL